MARIVFLAVCAIALGAFWFGSDKKHEYKTITTSATPTPALTVQEGPKPSPVVPQMAPGIPAAEKRKQPGPVKVRHVTGAAATEPVAVEDSRASKLAAEILRLRTGDRIEWTKKEFEKRGIHDVHDDQ